MKAAIMQPYIFPYFGYYQLINAVDKFIVYDDVNFIKQGWINRNNIMVNNSSYLFTVPLENQSSFSKINEINVHDKLYHIWLNKFLKTVNQNYSKAPFFKEVYPLLAAVFRFDENNISSMSLKSLKIVSQYLGFSTKFEESSSKYNNQTLTSQERVLDICLIENADHYINLVGGLDLYSKKDFLEKGIILSFIKSQKVEYKQFNDKFLPNLSIIDMLMFNDVETIRGLLNNYELI